MPHIIKLSERLSNMIAAGEVIERPASVIKELVENAIDAEATDIFVRITESGMKSIEVIDNGIGMDEEDALLAFERHATSKIKNEYDLYQIHSLGFRGEAVPSIASISKMTLKTKTEHTAGIEIIYEAGRLIHKGLTAQNKGTAIKVENLFYNVPARLKYVKSIQAEYAQISLMMDRFAISHPNIRFTFESDQKMVMQTRGNQDMNHVIVQLYGRSAIQNLNHFVSTQEDIKIEGFLVDPSVSKSKKNDIHILVNKRFVRNFMLVNAVVEGYQTYLPVHRYPVAVIRITIDPMRIDVNVHPTKAEIKFSNEFQIRDAIMDLVKNALNKEKVYIPRPMIASYDKEDFHQETLAFTHELHEAPEITLDSQKDEDSKTIISEIPVKNEAIQQAQNTTKTFPFLSYIGQFSGTYLLFQNEEGFYMLDQHAAAERIRYEHYYQALGNPGNASKPLLIPHNLELTKREALAMNENLQRLKDMGFHLEPSGINSFYLREIPLWVLEENALEVATDMLHFILENRRIDVEKIRDDLAKSVSCKGAIKANKALSTQEINALVKNLATCINPYTCPHGRPTLIHFSTYDIEKMFKRVM